MRIAVDCMGSDHGPSAAVRGAVAGLASLPEHASLVLVGAEADVQAQLESAEASDAIRQRIRCVFSTQVIEMADPPVAALRGKPDSSMARMLKLAIDREADAVISAGNTGAFVGGCQLKIPSLPNVPRCGLAVLLPTHHGPVVFLDVGANPEPKPHHLHAYAVLGNAVAELVLKKPTPRVGLMNVGTEDDKGTQLQAATRDLLCADPSIQFIGNVEGRDLYSGRVDVVVSDGFTGNVVLKAVEGQFFSLMHQLKAACSQMPAEIARHVGGLCKQLAASSDYQEYGGAHLLGPSVVCMKCHGSSDERAFKNAVRRAAEAIDSGLIQQLHTRLDALAKAES